ncbi:hypothetical protein CYMTET_55420 [Cymbomonas tetramitiformis]|uniref:Uncharacterized protein n=1 Tax=Cymbomonas tetramitiformis TaxID=36881 RepID=A0AAE0BER4_9CHLO|nr:hypothetical protein CYMTET_55420 [Cymbomonas tetramitiformis]
MATLPSRWSRTFYATSPSTTPTRGSSITRLLQFARRRSGVTNRQTPLSFAEFERLYCEPAEPTQPQAHPTDAQPSGSYHAVAPPNAAPETVVHFHSYATTNEDYPTYEDFASADASDPASPPHPPTTDTYSADSVQQPAHDPPATEPRTLDPVIPEWPRPGYFDASGHLPHLAHASLRNIPPEDLAEKLLEQPCTMFYYQYWIDDIAQGAPPAVSLVAYDQRNTGVTIARKQITDWPTPITDSNDTLHAKHNCARDGRRTMLEGTPAPDHPNRLHTLSKAIEKLDDRVDLFQALYHKIQDQEPTLLAYCTEEPPHAMFVGVRLLPQDDVAALKYPRRSDDDIGLRDITMVSLLTPVAPWVEQLMLRLQQDLQQPFGSHRPLAPFPPGTIPAPNPRWPGYNNPGYAHTDYTSIEGAPTFVITSSLDSDTNRSKSVDDSVHDSDDDVEMEVEQPARSVPWYLQHLPLSTPPAIKNYEEADAFDFQSSKWPAPAGIIFNQGDYDKYLHAQEHVLQVKQEYNEIDHLIHTTEPPTDGSHRITYNGMPLRCTGREVRRVEPDADGYARCCIVHRRMEAQVIIQVADKIWKGISTTSVNTDADTSNDEDDNAGAASNTEVANTTVSCMARTRMGNQPMPASFTRTGSPGGHSGELTAPVAMRSRPPAQDAAPTQAAHVVPHQEHDAAQMLMEASYTEEALESCLSASASISDTQRVPKEEVVRLTTKGAASKSTEHARFFERTAICYTIFNNDAKRGMLFFNQRSGVFQQHRCIIVDTGSMVLVMNRRHVQSLGLRTRPGSTIVDTSLGSAGTQTHQSWNSGELMIVASPGTSHEIVVVDVPGISPDADVKFDVLLSVQVMHAMSAGILPAVPGRGAALVYHPHNGSGDFTSKAYLPLRTLKPSNEVDDSYFSAHTCADNEVNNTIIHDVQQPRQPNNKPLYVMALLCVLLASFFTSASGALLDHQQDSKTGTYHATPMTMAMMCLCSIAALCSLFTAHSWTRRINPNHADATANDATPASWNAWASYSGQDAWRQIINPRFRSHQCAVSGTKIVMVANCYRPAAHLPQTIQQQVTTLMLINTIKVAQGFMPMTWDLFISQRQRMVHTPRFRIDHAAPSHVPTATRARTYNDARANTGIPVAQSAGHRHQSRRHGRSPPLPTWSLAVLCLACIACPSAAQVTNHDTNSPVETFIVSPLMETAVTFHTALATAVAMAATLTAILIAVIFACRSSRSTTPTLARSDSATSLAHQQQQYTGNGTEMHPSQDTRRLYLQMDGVYTVCSVEQAPRNSSTWARARFPGATNLTWVDKHRLAPYHHGMAGRSAASFIPDGATLLSRPTPPTYSP